MTFIEIGGEKMCQLRSPDRRVDIGFILDLKLGATRGKFIAFYCRLHPTDGHWRYFTYGKGHFGY